MTKSQRWEKRNDEGIELEREGKTLQAAELYEANLAEGCDSSLTYSRLAIIYHANRDYENEIRVLEKALSLVGESAGRFKPLEKRLHRAHYLKEYVPAEETILENVERVDVGEASLGERVTGSSRPVLWMLLILFFLLVACAALWLFV